VDEMKNSTNFLPTSRRSRQNLIAKTIAFLGVTVLVLAFTACSTITTSDSQFSIDVTPPTVEDDSPLPIESTPGAVLEPSASTYVGKAKVKAGMLDYQIKGLDSLSVGPNEEVPVGTDVKIWNNDEIANMELEDGSVIILNPSTALSFRIIESSTSPPVTRVILGSGSLLVASGDLWIITADYQFRIGVNESVTGVSYDPLQNMITVNCLGLKGSCLFYSLTNVDELTPGQQLEYIGGIRGEIGEADFEGWRTLYEKFVAPPTYTPTPTPTLTPTRTSTPTPSYTPTQIPTTAAPEPHSTNDELRKRKDGGGGDGGKGG
jgi:hypothetical protein